MSVRSQNFFVFTGGPGAGKTSVIEALAAEGWTCMPEAGRQIIRDQMRVSGTALPWHGRARYAELMLAADLRRYDAAMAGSGPVFFDRGIPDVIGYLRLEGLPVPDHMTGAATRLRYNDRAFIFPPWPEIYRQDAERRQTVELAERTNAAMADVYGELGYELIEVPTASVDERAAFVRHAIAGLLDRDN